MKLVTRITFTDGYVKAEDEDKAMHFTANRYLYDNNVMSIISDGDKGAWVQTETGVVHIEFVEDNDTFQKSLTLLNRLSIGFCSKHKSNTFVCYTFFK